MGVGVVSIYKWDAWADPDRSAADWLEEATAPWREGEYEPSRDQLLQAAEVAALLAIAERLQALIPLRGPTRGDG
jgi:hypothetical protein